MWRLRNEFILTREKLFMNGISDCNECCFCGQTEEHLLHLFVDCQFASEYWKILGIDLVNIMENDFVSSVSSMWGALELRLK